MAWRVSRDGEFTDRSAYIDVTNLRYKPHPPSLESYGNGVGPERIKLLLWHVAHNDLLANEA